jgi:hypothetical protein
MMEPAPIGGRRLHPIDLPFFLLLAFHQCMACLPEEEDRLAAM